MDSYTVEDSSVWDDLKKYSRARVPVDSEEFEGWWSKIQESKSLLIDKPIEQDDWEYLMNILEQADVSRIEHLVLRLPVEDYRSSRLETVYHGYEEVAELGYVLSAGPFSALKTLRILANKFEHPIDSLGSKALARALMTGKFTNLLTLSLPACDIPAILEGLIKGGICQLTSFSINRGQKSERYGIFASILHLNEILNAALKNECFKSLEHLDLSKGGLDGVDGWKIFSDAIKSGLLPNMKSLCLHQIDLGLISLVSLVDGPANWFSSLETLNMDGCGITSMQVRSLVNAIINRVATKELALKRLDLHNNSFTDEVIAALLRLANLDRLPKLQELDLSMNRMGSSALQSLMKSIQEGHLPNLQKLNWEGNKDNAAAEAIALSYFENEALTTEIAIDWGKVSDLSLKTKVKQYRERNVRLVALREQLQDDLGEFVPLTSAKVFLCGYPSVGKTTLRRSLQRDLGFKTKFKWETRPKFLKEPRTRGIELSRIKEKQNVRDRMALVFWDLAGQEEYHVLHGTFLADLGFAGGKATTFVLVFPAMLLGLDVKQKLLYWLRLVASSSFKHIKRHVVIVLNCFKGIQLTEGENRFWIALIRQFSVMFSDLLDIFLDPFIVDVRKATSVKSLKDHLFDQARTLLQDVGVPRICFELQEELQGWSERTKSSHLPILTWQAFEEAWGLKYHRRNFTGRVLKIAASYLHEIGEIIYLGENQSTEQTSANKSVVVPDPEWFCKKVVGQLLLPKEMLEGDSCLKVSADGSITVFLFQAFFEHLLVEGTESDDIISMLELLGLCYRKGREQIIVPVLIQQDDYSLIDWEGAGFHGVMGRCLAVEDHERSAIPVTLFRRFQVELAQDPNFGNRGDSGYRAGKSYSSFKVGEHLVLVQFDVDHLDPTDDRIDILVKGASREDPTDASLAQATCICEIMQKLETLCVSCCPGLRYDIKVIKPWSATEVTPTMVQRQLMSLTEIKDLLVKGQKYTSWQLRGYPVELKSFLSESELKGVLGIAERGYDECKRDAVNLGLLTEDSLQEIEARGDAGRYHPLSADTQSVSMRSESIDHGGLTTKIFHKGLQELKEVVREEGHRMRQYMDEKFTQLLSEIRLKHGILIRHIQEQQAFSIQEKERSVPRYMFLSRRQGKSNIWISLREAFKEPFELHFLCEAHFDDGFLHEVEPCQEGIQLTKTKEWLVKVSPWLRRSLRIAVMVGKTVGNLYLPGVFNFIPDFNYLQNDGKRLAKAVDSAATMMLDEGEGVNQVQAGQGNHGTAAQPVDLKEKLIAKEVVKDLMDDLGHAVFAKKIGLRKVLLRGTVQPHIGSSKQVQPSVLWICHDCFRKYEDRTTDITPRR